MLTEAEILHLLTYPKPDISSSRHVIVLNPILNDGAGDIYLGKKVVELLHSNGCHSTIYPIDISKRKYVPYGEHSTTKSTYHSYTHWILTPYSTIAMESLKNFIIEFVKWKPTKIMCIDEMDVYESCWTSGNLKRYRIETLNSVGFVDTCFHQLGFSGLGYFQLEACTIAHIKKLALDVLPIFFGDYDDFLYFFMYAHLPDSVIWFVNKMLQRPSSSRRVVFVSIGTVSIQYDKIEKKLYRSLQCDIKVYGSGTHVVHFITQPNVTHEMFLCLLHGCTEALVTGDQSLSEYISLTNRFPFYEERKWKGGIRLAVLKIAENNEELDFFKTKFTTSTETESLHPISPTKTDKHLSLMIANGCLAEFLGLKAARKESARVANIWYKKY